MAFCGGSRAEAAATILVLDEDRRHAELWIRPFFSLSGQPREKERSSQNGKVPDKTFLRQH